jgi:hypothetical protein
MSTNIDLAKMAIAGLSRKDRISLLAELQPGSTPVAATGPRVYSAKATAALFGRSVRMIHKLAAEGLLVRVTLPGRKTACGYTRESVEKLLTGGEV